MPVPFVVTPENAPSPLKLVGEQITVLASGAQTGSYEIFLQAGPESSGPPPHNHPGDESFYVIKGEIAFGIDGSETTALPGMLVHLPAASPPTSRRFYCVTRPGRARSQCPARVIWAAAITAAA